MIPQNLRVCICRECKETFKYTEVVKPKSRTELFLCLDCDRKLKIIQKLLTI
jgi:NAD-dependent SIR2 family protein deacetylase